MVFTFMTGPHPKSPPQSSSSPTSLPIAGMILTAVVLEFTMPIAASSAIMAAMVSAVVSPGTTIMSSPTEHTAVIASSFSMVKEPLFAAAIMPESSETGMNAPESPPTDEHAITPPFFTASFRSARVAVVPGAPHCSSPISSKICATLSPTCGVGASERSTMPNGTPSLSDAVTPTSCPTLVILYAIVLIMFETSFMFAPGFLASADLTTPGPETPTFIMQSGSPTPWYAPAINGLSSTELQNTMVKW